MQTAGGQTLLFDAGEAEGGGLLVGELRALGVRRIDWVIVSHAHADHYGGLGAVAAAMPVRRLADGVPADKPAPYRALRERLVRGGTEHHPLKGGDRVPVERGVWIEALTPRSGLPPSAERDPHNNGLVTRLVAGRLRVLFPGDLEKAGRMRLIREMPRVSVRAEVLVIANHGEASGTDVIWLRHVQPDIVVANSEPRSPSAARVAESALQRLVTSERRILHRCGALEAVEITMQGRDVWVRHVPLKPLERTLR